MPVPCPTPVAKLNHAWMGSEPDPEALVTRQAEGLVAASVASSIAEMAALPSMVLTFQVKATRSRQ